MNTLHLDVLDHGFVKLLNISGPVRRPGEEFDASDRDPAITARISFDNLDQERTEEQDAKLLKYLMDNQHWTPVEMVEIWLEMKLPLFIAAQMIRHRTACVNQQSARYSTLPAEWYLPLRENIGSKSKSNKQGRDISVPLAGHITTTFISDLNRACFASYEKYLYYLGCGVAPELARCFLHVNHYTHWVWKQDLRNVLGFLKLRLHPHAQYEVVVYAKAIYELLKDRLPLCMAYLKIDDQPL